jgi:membrane protease YdiL (CAAX protease family)
MNRQIRNLVIFSIISIGAGFIGIGIDRLSPPSDPMQGLGVLIWLASPLAINLILRAFGGDKWADLGLRPYFKQSWGWYLIALAIPVIVTGATLAIGAVFGKNSLYNFSRMGFSAFLPFFLAGILGAMMKNFFEEFAWRGYLTPRLEAIGAHPFINSILTGFV